MAKLSRDYQVIFDTLKQENRKGLFANNTFIRRNLSQRDFKHSSLQEVFMMMSSEGHLHSFNYLDDTLYVLNDKESLIAVESGWIKQEKRTVSNNITSTNDKNRKQKLKFQESILKNIESKLLEAIENVKNSKRDESTVLEKEIEKKIGPIIKTRITKATEKFLTSYSLKDLISLEALSRSDIIMGNVGVGELRTVLDNWQSQKDLEAFEIHLSNKEKLYINVTTIGVKGYQAIQTRRDEFKKLAEQKKTDGNKHEDLAEYHDYIRFDLLDKRLEEAVGYMRQSKQVNYETELSSMVSDDTHKKKSKTEEPSHNEIPEVNTPNTNEGSHLEKEESKNTLDDGHIDADQGKADFLPVTEQALEEMNENELLNELEKNLYYTSSRELLLDYYDQIRTQSDEHLLKTCIDTFFTCIQMLIKIPSDNNEKVYDLAKAILYKIEKIDPNDRERMLGKLEEAYTLFEQNMEERSLLERYDLFD